MVDSVIEKVKKLLALAEGNQNENERNVAMQFAMDLLAKHNLTVAEISETSINFDVVEVEGNFRLEPWMRRTLSAACTLYYTDFYTSPRYDYWRGTQKDVPVFVGTSENIEVTIQMATWLLDSIRLESNREFKDSRLRRSFRLGAATRLFRRAVELVSKEQTEETSTTGSSLVVIRNKLECANKDYLDTLDLSPCRSRTIFVNQEAYAAGDAYGGQISLDHSSNKVRARLPLFNSN